MAIEYEEKEENRVGRPSRRAWPRPPRTSQPSESVIAGARSTMILGPPARSHGDRGGRSRRRAMDHSAVKARFVDDFLLAHGPCRGGEILDVGTGTARIPIALAWATAGLDPGTGPVRDHARGAGVNINAAGLSGRNPNSAITETPSRCQPLRRGLIRGGGLDTIVPSYPRPRPALESMVRLVRMGGTLMVRDVACPNRTMRLSASPTPTPRSESPEARRSSRPRSAHL